MTDRLRLGRRVFLAMIAVAVVGLGWRRLRADYGEAGYGTGGYGE